ncbi:N-acetylmuramoyl-L-alanine amidase [Amycolatopsis antarctica]|uniref:N-acetylmuramoyl-L-alanine amidase n=1 Tax=Amycolatopsis antarctica TaxID=1854586 RepID=A0A263CXN8_9PSEU|nr:N-acetylmuramoyl-L-alanine amidase [Amycolatopsis antarctica]OZM70914.1 N-acetylmuramoyl-L-alanine amidase [Amycolatopsis antarctica]
MAEKPGFDRRALLKGGLTVTAVGALTALPIGTASAAPIARRAANGTVAAPPQMFGTSDWGARPPSGAIVVENHKPTYIVVHHTADPGNSEDYSKEHAFEISRVIQNAHMDGNGWVDSGQQFTNSRGGFITEGRHRSIEILNGGTQHVQGANVGNHNSEVIGIENEGIYVDVDVPPALWTSLVQLVAYMASQYGVAPANIKGHRDFNATECPGTVLYGRLPELRQAVGGALGVEVREATEWPLLKPGQTGQKVLAAQHLLREQGARNVPTDGVFGPSTADAVESLSAARGLEKHSCTATMRSEERGFLGADLLPLITPAVAPGTNTEAARAAGVLANAAGVRTASLGTLNTQAWKELLSA